MPTEESSKAAPDAPEPRTPRWGQDRRLEFIDFRLRWDGRINRGDLTAFFGISVPQASLDIARYLELAPDNAIYDRSGRVYLAAPTFRPQYPNNQPRRYLNELLAREAGVLQPELSFLGWAPPTDITPNPGRQISFDVLAPLLRAIRAKLQVVVSYQSMSSLEPTRRELSPHAFGYDGFRWHVRAYCNLREKFLDFVIARILGIEETEAAGVSPDTDEAWHRKVALILSPNPALPEASQRVIELDYGMTDGQVVIECRQALLFYALKRLGLLEGQEARPEVQQIVLKNKAELEPHLPKSASPR